MANFADLTTVLQKEIESWEGRTSLESTGFVAQVGDGVATVYGLDKAIYGELVEFASGAVGIVLNLVEDGVGCVLLSGESLAKDGEEARGTGRVVSVPVGLPLLGRV
ncbi:MAG: F0F1 ATP synthase subunit alpha, partial [Spirochaetaceae bacterium]|nr:F0F1 ATP synthase subunit alpha [Spirochaetaceae bacterium]